MAFLTILSDCFDDSSSVTSHGTEGFDDFIANLDALIDRLWQAAGEDVAESYFFAGLVCRKIETNKRVWYKEYEVLGPGRKPVFRFSCRRIGDDVVSVWEGGIADKASAQNADAINLAILLANAQTALLESENLLIEAPEPVIV